MKDKILNKVDEMVEVIKNSDEYQKYIEVSSKMQQNEDIMRLINEVKTLQKTLVKEKSLGKDIKGIEDEIQKKIHALEEYPLYLDYTYLQEDLNSSINLIKSSIENYIDKVIN